MTSDHPTASDTAPPSSVGNVFVRAWQGKVHLALVWWGFGIPLKVLAWALNAQWTFEVIYRRRATVAIAAWLVTMLAYLVISVMVWRCAPNTEEKGWKWVARTLLVGSWVWFIYRLVTPAG